MKHLSIFVLVFILVSCSNSAKGNAEPKVVPTANSVVPSSVVAEVPVMPSKEIVNEDSGLNIESVAVLTPEADRWFIGKTIGEETINKKNCTITTDVFGATFGPIDGYRNDSMIIGWNNRNRIVYIEIVTNSVKTVDGFTIGSSKQDILSKFGVPYIETEDQFRYQNTDFEIVGILFKFDKSDKVISTILFTYV